MATNTYTALGSYTVTGSNLYGPTGISLTIPSGYTDIRIVFSGSVTAASITCLKFNNSSGGTDYSWTWMGGNGSATSSNRGANQALTFITNMGHMTASQGNILVDVMQYSNTNVYKTVLSRANNGGGLGLDSTVSIWRSTAAITSVQIFLDRAEYFVVGSTFTVYGIAAQPAVSTAKATGGTITYDAFGRVIHTFTSSGTFTPSEALAEVEYLVVAGGGGAGTNSGELGGGGGAGGVRSGTASLAASTGYTVTVGQGGPGGSSGTNSSFSATTATGGGRGGNQGNVGVSGGSGGGGANQSQAGGSGNAGAYSPVEGYAGGNGGYYSAGGGGGAGAVGANAGSQVGGNGGTGIVSTITGALVYYGGGGGGSANTRGSGGAGGGGVGASASAGTGAGSGTANTGGGGGGSAGGYGPGSGGSGVVIIRYQG